MANLKEIESYARNMNYYSQQITDIVTRQFNEDASRSEINAQAGSVRFGSLAAIATACTQIDCYCVNVLANLKTAMEQGKKLHLEEELEPIAEEQGAF